MRVLYVDTLFFLNFAVNYLLLLATAKISAAYVGRLKIALGALLGAAYAVAAVLVAQSLMQSLWFKIGAAVLMLLICFGREKGLLRISLIFFSVSAAFGGVVFAVSLLGGGSANEALVPVSMKVLVPAFAVSYAVISLMFRQFGKRRAGGFVHITVELKGRKAEFNSMVDTGNALTDPMSGKTVIIAETGALSRLFEPKALEILGSKEWSASEMLERLADCGMMFRLLPFSSVGTERGMLLAFKPDAVTVDGKDRTGTLVALSQTRLSEGGIYSAIVGSQVLEAKA